MIQGSCHCGAVQWRFDAMPESATACNCTVCRRYGVLWAYDYEDEGIHVSGATQAYVRGKSIGFHFCPACGCVAYWRSLEPDKEGRRRIAVNLRWWRRFRLTISTGLTALKTCHETGAVSQTIGSESALP